MFGQNNNVPFLFQEPLPPSSHTPPWAPPPNFSPVKAFPQPEVRDVDMSEFSPPKPSGAPHEKDAPGESEADRAYAVGAMRRVYKARQRGKSLVRRAKSKGIDDEGSDTEDDSGDEGAVTPMTQNMSNHYTLNMPGPAPPQRDLPYVLSGYLQFFFNLSLILLCLYVIIRFMLIIQHDVDERISEYSMDIVQDIAQCALQYKLNLCATNPIPAMAHQCAMWESCMNRDPSKVGRAKVSAELVAEVVNSFVEPISWKTMAFSVTSMAFLTVFVNALLSLYRARRHAAVPPPHVPQVPPIPSFPIAPASPYPHRYLTPPPDWGKSWSSEELMQTPSRRRRLEGGLAAKIQ
ncbi:Di-sulfide bridge nucleocytoplasmic transport domain-containing protein [Amylocystis lapponica]|nr:Di-sulfide bridge nucleocytoplasmic transport domain-containing protein [Amylocystis lapponica]